MMRLGVGSLFLVVTGCGLSGAVSGEGAASISKGNCEPCSPDAGDAGAANAPGAPGDGNTGGGAAGSDSEASGETATCENGCVVRPSNSGEPNPTGSSNTPPPQIVLGNPAVPNAPVVPFTPLPPPPSEPGCGLVPPTCPASKTLPDGSACDPMGSDWWPKKSEDQAGTHHTPAGSIVTDFRAEHITPYGGWFTFTSVQTSEFDDDLMLCWSTEETGLDTASAMQQAKDDSRCIDENTFARKGVEPFPLIVTQLEPDTTYFFRLGYEVYDGINNLSNVVSFKTSPDPMTALNPDHPRVFTTQAHVDSLKARYDANDERTRYWVELSEERTRRAADPNDDISGAGSYAMLSALLGKVTGDSTYTDGAKYLLEHVLLEEYESQVLTGNQYRWATANLATTTDMLWNDLDVTMRQRILDAMLEEDETESAVNPLFMDTDEYAACTQNQIAHGLTFLGATDLDPASLKRMEAVLDRALRRWYGALLVKARRGDKIWGISGGTMDDGIGYARGTQEYWLQTFWMLENSGFSQADYAQWIWNHARNQSIYGIVPDNSGYVTYGDIEDASQSGVLSLSAESWSSDALNICLLEKYCWDTEAAIVQDALSKSREPAEFGGPHHWALLCDNSALPKQSFTALPTAYRANGFGLVFDRTGWGADDSFFFFSAGWRSVDHVHDDAGHFSLWSQRKFVTHEEPSYDMENAQKHNVLLLSGSSQNNLESSGVARILETDTNSQRLYILADLTSAYNEDYADKGVTRIIHDEITRSIVWDKRSNAVLVYDRVVGGPNETGEQNFLGGPVVTELYNERDGDRLELMSIVNGVGELSVSDTQIGVDGLGAFDRATGKLIQ